MSVNQQGTKRSANQMSGEASGDFSLINVPSSYVTCAVCMDPLSRAYMILECGHMFCTGCAENVNKSSRGRKFPCPTCRRQCTLTNQRSPLVDLIMSQYTLTAECGEQVVGWDSLDDHKMGACRKCSESTLQEALEATRNEAKRARRLEEENAAMSEELHHLRAQLEFDIRPVPQTPPRRRSTSRRRGRTGTQVAPISVDESPLGRPDLASFSDDGEIDLDRF